MLFTYFLKSIDVDLHDNFIKEKFIEDNINNPKVESKPDITKFSIPKFMSGTSPLKQLKKVSSLPIDHPFKKYVMSRKIPSHHQYRLFYCESFKKWVNSFTIGNGDPEGIVVVVFMISFILILVFAGYTIIYSLGHAFKLDFDMKDLAINLGAYAGVAGLYMFSIYYLGNAQMESILLLCLQIGAVTHVFLPALYFILNITVGSYMEKRIKGVDF
jgi:hypothetical protein